MVQPPFEIFSVPPWLRVLTWSGTTILKTVLYGEIIWEVDNVYYEILLRHFYSSCGILMIK